MKAFVLIKIFTNYLHIGFNKGLPLLMNIFTLNIVYINLVLEVIEWYLIYI